MAATHSLFWLVHGLCMVMGITLATGITMILKRLLSKGPRLTATNVQQEHKQSLKERFLDVHLKLQALGMVLVYCGFFLALYLQQESILLRLQHVHNAVGYFLVLLIGLILPFLGFADPYFEDQHDTEKKPSFWLVKLHKLLGKCTFYLSLAALCTGLYKYMF